MQINKENISYDIMLLMCLTAELHPLLKKEGLDVHHGIVLIMETKSDLDRMIDLLIESGAILCRSFKRPTENIQNTEFAVHNYVKYDKEEAVLEFLESGFFLPMVVTCGFVPDFLKTASNVLVVDEFDIKDVQAHQLLEDIDGFKTYVREYPPGIVRKLHSFKTSDEFLQQDHRTLLHTTFLSIIDIFEDFYRCSHSESEWEKMKIRLKDSVKHFCDISEDYAEGWDILDAIRSSTYAYIDEHPEILIDQIDKIEGELLEATEKGNAILYDAKFYYFPEKVLRTACSPLLETISFLDIKAQLKEGGILYCNSTNTRNYTVKKLLTNAYGKVFRVRFLKLKKIFFVTPDCLGLEERREANICLSEILTEDPVQ